MMKKHFAKLQGIMLNGSFWTSADLRTLTVTTVDEALLRVMPSGDHCARFLVRSLVSPLLHSWVNASNLQSLAGIHGAPLLEPRRVPAFVSDGKDQINHAVPRRHPELFKSSELDQKWPTLNWIQTALIRIYIFLKQICILSRIFVLIIVILIFSSIRSIL